MEWNDFVSNTQRSYSDPVGAFQHAWGVVTGKAPPPPQIASDIYAQLTREQWANYMNTFVPIENQLIQYATDKTQPTQAMAQASEDVNAAYGAQAGATTRRLSGLGVALTPEEEASAARSTGLSKGLADVGAQNMARDLTIDRQQSILGNPSPSVGPMNMPQGV